MRVLEVKHVRRVNNTNVQIIESGNENLRGNSNLLTALLGWPNFHPRNEGVENCVSKVWEPDDLG